MCIKWESEIFMTGKKLKILIVHNYYKIPGGEDTVVANEKSMLEEQGHEVTLYTRSNAELSQFSKWQKLWLPFTTIFNFRTYKEIKKIILEQKIDLVHVHNTLNLISPSVYYAAFHCHVPVVQTIHNYRLLCPGATFYRDGHICEDCVSHGLQCAVKRRCYRDSSVQTLACVITTKIYRLLGTYGRLYYICLTEFNKEKLLNLKIIKPDHVFVRPNFATGAESIIPYEKRRKRFVYAGRLDELKGIPLLLEAWKRMGEEAPQLILCGTGPLEEWCKTYLHENHLNTVEMRGKITNHEVKEILADSLALILPTQWYEGFPMSVLEAYSVGTPVIGSNLGNTGSIIEEDRTGWKFQHDSAESLITAIGKVSDRVSCVTEQYQRLYSQGQSYQRLMEIYTTVLEREH